ncbi:MAG: hypothetical protein ABW212_16725, partial [Pseudonocardia sediminis]
SWGGGGRPPARPRPPPPGAGPAARARPGAAATPPPRPGLGAGVGGGEPAQQHRGPGHLLVDGPVLQERRTRVLVHVLHRAALHAVPAVQGRGQPGAVDGDGAGHRDTLLTELDRHRREHETVVVLVSHDPGVLRAADRVVHLHDGRAVAPQARVDSSSGGRPAGWNR